MLVGYSSSSEEENEIIQNGKRKGENHQNDNSSLDNKRCRKEAGCVLKVTRLQSVTDGKKSPSHAKGEEARPPQQCVPEQRPRLPMPGSVLNMFKETEEEEGFEDRTQYGGRIRSFAHERGNWATYVYLPYLAEEESLELVDQLISGAGAHGVSLTRMEEFHISLSQTVILRHHWIEPFVLSLKEGLASGRRFLCVADRLKVYTNQERTRTFLGLEVRAGHAQVLEMVRVIDRTMQEFNLSTFHQNPSFHISLAWCVGDCSESLRGCCQELQNIVDDFEDSASLLRFSGHEIRCKSGNKFFSFPLL
ncbi:U6 snRNA phosphodiesterase [Polyodon spathula]|uniref:U6 snRNA phosphodiesterase n=1 Tax=Polyodon spathula TaxID=7913 RepID=UPI001B7DFE43|nr:U6 snRNA phosphodiesterase [Polyodon spathula]